LYDTTQFGEPGPFPDDDLRRLLRRLVRAAGLLEPHDHGGLHVSVSEAFALGELVEADTMSQQELAARLGLEKSTVSRLAAGLERRGWLSREREVANRRLYRLRLTTKGRAVAQRVGHHYQAQHAELFEALTPAERAGLSLGIAGLIRVIESGGARLHASGR
jgi:DNA-binding MarR family transcriptional regulator